MSRTTRPSTTPSFAEASALCIEEATEILNLLKVTVNLTPESVRDEAVDSVICMIQDFLVDVIDLPVGEDYDAVDLDPYMEEDE